MKHIKRCCTQRVVGCHPSCLMLVFLLDQQENIEKYFLNEHNLHLYEQRSFNHVLLSVRDLS